MKKVMICLVLCSALILTGCNESTKNQNIAGNNNSTEISTSGENKSSDADKDVNNKDADSENNSSSSKSKPAAKNESGTNIEKSKEQSGSSSSHENNETSNISSKVKAYILGDQGGKSEAEKVKWSNVFLNKVDVDSLYKKYVADGGNKNSVEDFALYITKNAPVQSNWKKLFEADLGQKYGVKVTKLEHLEGDMYQAYISSDGKDVPYVTVNSRTGYFHG